MLREIIKRFKSVDFPFLVVTLVLVGLGIVAVFSASYYYSIATMGTPFYFLIRELIYVVIGFGMLIAGMMIKYENYQNGKFIAAVFIGELLLLILVLFIGMEGNGAQRAIGIGPFSLMPGEMAKPAVILIAAWYLSKYPRATDKLLGWLIPTGALLGLYVLLILKQPNLSTALTVCGIAVMMLLVAGIKWRYFIGLGALGLAGLFSILTFAPNSYWASRIHNFTNPFADAAGEGYQVYQSLLALGSGGLKGVGFGKSVQKSLYLPEPQNDFILAIIGEEVGFIGIMILLLIYCYFIYRGIRITLNAPDQFGLLLGTGIIAMVAIQVVLNIAVVTASMPPTGINLPFISYGGNALLIFMFLSGVILNISRHKPETIEDEFLE